MKERHFLHSLFILGTTLVMCNLLFYFSKHLDTPNTQGLLVQNTYMGPTSSSIDNSSFVRVEVLVRDSSDLAGVQIRNVTFNGQEIPMKPRDILGKRASASFQLPPGNYILRWTVEKDKIIWPRTISHEEVVTISPRDLWIQILIEGEQVSIS